MFPELTFFKCMLSHMDRQIACNWTKYRTLKLVHLVHQRFQIPQLLIVSSRVPSGQMDGVAHIIYHKTSVKKYFLDAAAWSIVQQKHVIKFELLTYFLVNYEIHRAILRKKALLNTVNRFSDVCLSNRILKILLYVPHCLFDQVGFLS